MKRLIAMGFACEPIALPSNSTLARVCRIVSSVAAQFIPGITVGLLSFLLTMPVVFGAQKKSISAKPKSTQARKPKATTPKPVDELAKLHDEYIKATNEY